MEGTMIGSRARPVSVAMVLMCAVGLAGGVYAADKIEPRLLEELMRSGSSDFVVVFAEQADLSAAEHLAWRERGEFVYHELRRVSERAQASIRELLGRREVRHRSFLAGNEIYVWGGSPSLALSLAQRPEVAMLRAPRTHRIGEVREVEPTASFGSRAVGWGIADSGGEQFWSAFGVQGDGIVVAEMTTGVEWNHPALDQAFRCGGNPADPACWFDPSNICGGSMCDNNGFGTRQIGVVVGDDDPMLAWQVGMAPGATWIACKACEASSCSTFAIESCADWFLAPDGDPGNRPHVVLVGWSGGSCDDWFLPKVNAWRAAGILPVGMAGNSGPSCGSLGSPGDYQEVLATAAHDSSRTIASFSSRGPSCYGHEPFTKPNISAPGVSICSSEVGGGFGCTSSGTHIAASHVAGAAALLWSCAPHLTGQIDATMGVLQDAAGVTPVGDCGAPPDGEGNYTYGYGYLDVYAAGVAACLGLPFSDGFESGDTSAWSSTVPPDVYLFDGGGSDDALGGRAGADLMCATAVTGYPSIPSTHVRAFISVDAGDEIRDLPANYGVPAGTRILSPTGVKIADTWADLLDGDIDQSLADAGVLTTASWWYSGSTADGSLHPNNCVGWTHPNLLLGGRYGTNQFTDDRWITNSDATCGLSNYHVLCVAW
jgi:hypothetical protein